MASPSIQTTPTTKFDERQEAAPKAHWIHQVRHHVLVRHGTTNA
jgi:hypothetical protein